jgi:hypothetical protein
MLEEVKKEEHVGYNMSSGLSDPFKSSKDQQPPSHQQQPSKKKHEEIIDTYGDDFDEEIVEELPEDNNLLDSNENVGRGVNPAQSLGGITVS